jgi:hypothetical protein
MKIKLMAFAVLLAMSAWTCFNSCSKDNNNTNASTGKGGSLARFTIAGNYLYAVDNHFLYAYSLSNPVKPEKVYTSPLKVDIETIYPYGKFLFLGTRTGIYIYSIETPSKPSLIGEARHARSCDPVVVNDSVAFVTLRSNGSCGPAVSGLYIHDIKSITQPVLKKTVELPDPVGLGLQDSVLYVCCGDAGLKVFNVKNPYDPELLATKTDGRFVDVIAYNGILICFVQDGILLYNINNPASPVLVKKIAN